MGSGLPAHQGRTCQQGRRGHMRGGAGRPTRLEDQSRRWPADGWQGVQYFQTGVCRPCFGPPGAKVSAPVNRVGEGSSAQEQGVKIGWKIKAINGNLTAGKEINAFIKEFADLVSALPDK